MTRVDLRFVLLFLLFFLSGFTALIYQTAWTREFSFVFGTSSLAVATVLAAYMGGLAAGSALAGRFIGSIRRPVLVYGLLELGIALSALAIPYLIKAATWLHRALLGGLDVLPTQGGANSAVFFLVTSFLILSLPTAMMGATLPMLARYAVRKETEIGRRIGSLYAINTTGAIVGTIVAAFLLLPALGVMRTVLVGASMNCVIFLGAVLLARGTKGPRAIGTRAPVTASNRLVLVVMLGAGVASFTYEVLWTRLLEHVLGGSVYAFATMLASFLIGIAIGSAIAAQRATTRRNAGAGLTLCLAGAGLFSLLAFATVDQWPSLMVSVPWPGLPGILARASIAAMILLPSTLCIGATFPFAVRMISGSVEDAAPVTAKVYAWNTVGAIVGSIAAGFLIIPGFGFAGTITSAAVLNLVLALAVAAVLRPTRRAFFIIPVAVLAFLMVMPPQIPWQLLKTPPMKIARTSAQGLPLSDDFADFTTEFFAVGRSSTVLLLKNSFGLTLRNNGLPEATILRKGSPPGVGISAHWLGALPAFTAGGVERMLVIGLGGGVVLENVPNSVQKIDVVELEPEVVRANRIASTARKSDPLDDRRVQIYVNDARSALELTRVRYDAIVSQPSHPWTAGASHLYTRDFFSLVRSRLAEQGVFVQWMALSFVDRELLRTLIATLLDVFPNVRVYMPTDQVLLMVASAVEIDFEAQVEEVVAADPVTAAALGVRVREDLAMMLLIDEVGARSFAYDAPISTDDYNLLALRSPLVIEAESRRDGSMLGHLDRLSMPPDGWDKMYVVRRLLEMGQIRRAVRFMGSIRDQAQHDAAQGEIERFLGRAAPAEKFFRQSLELDPDVPLARFRVVEAHRYGWLNGDEEIMELAALLDAPGQIVLEGWRHQAINNWMAVEALEPQLATVPVSHVAHRAAVELRMAWRLARGDADHAVQALALMDADPRGWTPGAFARRARIGTQAGRPDVTRASLGLARN